MIEIQTPPAYPDSWQAIHYSPHSLKAGRHPPHVPVTLRVGRRPPAYAAHVLFSLGVYFVVFK